jgi:hypothetical protein
VTTADETAGEDDDEGAENVAFAPGPGADSAEEVNRCVPQEILDLYEVHSYRHAASILWNNHTTEIGEIVSALRSFNLSTDDIRKAGGNETDIVKRVTGLLRGKDWLETRIKADLKVTKETKRTVSARKGGPSKEITSVDIPNFLDGHKVDFVKGRVAFDMEWNSKDQTFDRDLYAFRAFYDCSLISAGILLTRSASLNPVFAALGEYPPASGKRVKDKYGASTTWMGKLCTD